MRKAIPKKTRQLVLSKYEGYCGYCGYRPDKLQIDHIDPVRNHWQIEDNANYIENLMPACPPCNNFKMTFNLEQFRREIKQQVERARKYSVNFRTAERFGLLKINEEKEVVFYFETLKKV